MVNARPAGSRSRRLWPAIRPALALAGAAATLTAGCANHSGASYRAVCENARTQMRVADRQCPAAPSAQPTSAPGQPGTAVQQSQLTFQWRYYRSGQSAPAIGSKSSGGTTTPPEDGEPVVRGGVPASGGVVSGDDGSGSGSDGGSTDGGGDGGDGGGSGGGGE